MRLLRKYSSFLLLLSTLLYTQLSYILLFRSKDVDGIAHFYPAWEKFLFTTRDFLLLHGLNTIPTGVFTLLMLVSFLAYFSSLKQKVNIKKTIIIAVALQIISFFAFPIIESDIFSYISSDRVSTVYHQNVWKVAPSQAGEDKFLELADWKDYTRVYGGVNQLIYSPISKIAGNDLLRSIVFYKTVVLIFTLLSIYMVFLISSNFFKGAESFAIKLVFWNPLFLLNIVGAGHNDAVMLFFMLASYYFYLKRKQLFAGSFLALAIQTKIVAGFLFPFLFLNLLLKKDLRGAANFTFSSTVLTLAFFPFMGINPLEFVLRVLKNSSIYWQGLPSLLFHLVGSTTNLFIFGFAIVNIFLAVYQIRSRGKVNPILIYCASTFLYLVLFTSAYWNWYMLWALVFIPFVKNKALSYAILVFSFTSTLGYAIYWLALRYNYQNVAWQIMLYLFILFIPFLVWLFMNREQFARIGRGYNSH